MTIRVLLVDDDPLVRAGLRLMLRSAPDIAVVGEAADGAAAITAAAELAPHVVLMDIRMPGTDGVTATAQITRAQSTRAQSTRAELTAGGTAPRVVALTTFDADELVRQAITAGAVIAWSRTRRRARSSARSGSSRPGTGCCHRQ
jgi:DNA-binding NarL/FixJ family response regulator